MQNALFGNTQTLIKAALGNTLLRVACVWLNDVDKFASPNAQECRRVNIRGEVAARRLQKRVLTNEEEVFSFEVSA